jgi:hypothetical protein
LRGAANSKHEATHAIAADTLGWIATVPAGAEINRSMRAAACATSGTHASHAVIDLVCQRS